MYKLFLFLLVPFLCKAQNTKLDASTGFGSFKFGSSPKEHKDLTLEIADGNTKLYSISRPVINVEGIEFDYVRLTFLNNKLATISMQTKNISAHKMLQTLKETYGDPKRNRTNNNCEWKGKWVELIFSSTKNIAVIDFYSKKIK